MKQQKIRISANEKISAPFYRMRIASSYLARNCRPGQFIEVRSSDSFEPLLRRPFSVHRIARNGIELLYGVVGKATEELSRKETGEYLDVIGPLGNGFNLSAKRYPLNAILVAGGMGVAPLLALAERLAYSVQRIAYRKKTKIYVLIGAKTKNHVLCEKDFKKLGAKVMITTDDGTLGKKGLITDVLHDLLSAIRYPLSAKIFACGPNAMLKTVAKLAKERRIKCQVSLEEMMACGVGVCLGCPVKVNTNYEYKMVCKDGPVFNAEEIAW